MITFKIEKVNTHSERMCCV